MNFANKDTTVQQPARVAPVHPKFPSSPESDEESEGEGFYESSHFVSHGLLAI